MLLCSLLLLVDVVAVLVFSPMLLPVALFKGAVVVVVAWNHIFFACCWPWANVQNRSCTGVILVVVFVVVVALAA